MSSVFCVTNFVLFEKATYRIGRFDETVMYADLDRQLSSSVLPDRQTGLIMIPRNREQLANRYNCSVKTAKEKLNNLVNKGLLESRIGMWYKKKSFFISKAADIDVWLDYEKLSLLTEHTKSDEASMFLSFIDYCTNKRPIKDNGKTYAFVSRPKAAKILKCSTKTVDNYAKILQGLGIIEYDMRNGWEVRNFYVTINEDFYTKACAEWEAKKKEYIEQKRAKQEKIALSIRITNSSDDLKNNNTASNPQFTKDTPESAQSRDVILSRKEQRYLRGALTRTLDKIPDNPYNMQALFNQVFYAITNPSFLKTTQSFNHAVNRFMFLIRNKRWGCPFGYNKYDSNGKKEWQEILAREEADKYQPPKKGVTVASLAKAATNGFAPLNPEDFEEKKPTQSPVIANVDTPEDAEERKRKLADLERRWQESRYGL